MKPLKIGKSITDRETASLEYYLNEISNIPCLTPEEEVVLGKQIKDGDKAALDKLISANLKFVVSIAKKYQGVGLSLPDLIGFGRIGLIKAAQRFDETKGFKFISYAVYWIRVQILIALGKEGKIIQLPQSQIALRNTVEKFINKFTLTHGYKPDLREVADACGKKMENIREMLKCSEPHLSLDEPLSEHEDMTLIETLEDPSVEHPDQELNRKSLSSTIQRVLSFLKERDRYIICAYYGIGEPLGIKKSPEDIGKRLDLGKERVRQLHDKALKKLIKRYEKLLRNVA